MSYSRVISSYRLSDWLKKFCIKPSLLFKSAAEREVFIDRHGIKRYIDNWQPVAAENDVEEVLAQSSENFFFRTGCMKLSHLYESYQRWSREQEENNEKNGEEVRASDALHQIAYISEWQRLWIHLENNTDYDELAEHAPLFRLMIEFLFHPRMQTMMMVLLTYNIIITLVLILLFPSVYSPMTIFYGFFELVVQTIAYFAIVVVYRGIVTEPPEPAFPIDVSLLQELNPNTLFSNINTGLNTLNTGLRESLRQINVVSGLHTRQNALELTSKSRDEEARVQLDREENGSTDVFYANPMRSTSPLHPAVTPHSAHPIDLPDAPSKPRRPDVSISAMTNSTNIFNHFRMIRRELVSRVKFELSRLHPLLARCFSFNFQNIRMQQKQERFLRYRVRMKKLSYHEILNIALKFLVDINHVNMQSINFDRPTYRLILLFICIVFPIYVFFSRTLVWYIIAPISQCPNGLLTSDSAEVCRYYFYFLLLTLGSMTLYFVQLIFGMSIMVALVSLSYGSEIAYRLTDAWIKKFKSLRRVEEYDMEEFIDQNLEKKKNASIGRNHSGRSSVKAAVVTSDEVMPFVSKRQFHFESEKNICEHPLYYWIKRDATEHYFFICEVFQASDRIWSPALTFIFLMAVGIALVAVLYAVLLGNISHPIVLLQTIIFASVRIFVLFIYPLMSLCHANAYIYELTNCFRRASKDDFQLIGGCEQWIDFMENCPAAWTYNGIWITWDRLLGLVWTFAAAAVASGLGTLLSFVSS